MTSRQRSVDRERASKGITLAADAITCPVCAVRYNSITAGHYRKHGFQDAASFMAAFSLTTLKAPSISAKQAAFMAENSPTKGKSRTEAEVAKMSAARKGKGVGVAGKYARTAEVREKISAGVSQFMRENPHATLASHKRSYVLSEKADTKVLVRSSWEARVLEVLDACEGVDEVQVEPYAIPYFFEGCQHLYWPDILVTYEGDVRELWEVKPKEFVGFPRNVAKFAAARAFCQQQGMGFRVVTLADIERMELRTYLQQARESCFREQVACLRT